MSWPVTRIALRLRLTSTVSAAVGLVAVMLMVGALFPAVGHTIGKLDIPPSVANLLGGADYGTITGWFRSEIAVIYAPLVIGALAITGASAVTAGEEEDRILALVLAHPLRRSRLVVAKAAAVALIVLFVAFAVWVGLLAGVTVGGGGISVGHITALAVQLAFFGLAMGAVALALGAGTGSRSLSNAGAAAIAILGGSSTALPRSWARSPGSSTSPSSTTTPATTRSRAASGSRASSSSVSRLSL